MHESAIFSPKRGGGVRRVRPMLDPPLRYVVIGGEVDCALEHSVD